MAGDPRTVEADASHSWYGTHSMSETATRPDDEEGRLEGIEEQGRSWGDYPIDNLLIQTRPLSVRETVHKIDKGGFIMNPDFQRDFVWHDEKQSRLIESVLMRIPLPVFYLAEDDLGRYVVVDGLQRLTTFRRFLDGQLTLQLPDRSELHGKRFDDLSPKLQTRLEDCTLTLYVLDSKAPERARLDIFERVNGGVPLTRQQMRNCLYMGSATRFLKEEAATALFRQATGGSLDATTMRDREFVNRFCAFKLLSPARYKDDMDEFLATALKAMNKMDEAELEELRASFRRGLENNVQVFGKHAFRKYRAGQERRSVLNLALFEVMSTGLSSREPALVLQRKDGILAAFFRLMDDAEFNKAVTTGTNGGNAVRLRFDKVRAALAEVFGADADRA